MQDFARGVAALTTLRALQVYTSLPLMRFLLGSLTLASLDLDFQDWTWTESQSSLCSLVLRNVTVSGPFDSVLLATLVLCPNLRALALIGKSNTPGALPEIFDPSQLASLQLAGLYPCSPLRIATVWLERESFSFMTAKDQALMRQGVKNLYLVEKLVITDSLS